jgi:amino-acid racemase
MKTIGLIGGMSWESTRIYYDAVNVEVRTRLGGLHSAKCIVHSLDFAPIAEMQAAGRWEEAGQVLAGAARDLERGGAEVLGLCTNTMHKVADQVQAAIDIPLLHLGDATADAVRAAGLSTVGLLGTAFTMEQDFYRDRLAGHGLRVLVPGADDRAEVHRVIYDELCLGDVRPESRAFYRGVIDRLVASGAEGIILGCTEIELLVSAADSPVPVFPTSRLHVEAAVDAALRDVTALPGTPRQVARSASQMSTVD